MKILLIHQYFATPGESGGTRHYELCRHLVDQGHEVTIVASDLSYHTGQRLTPAPRLVTEQPLDGLRLLRAYTYPSLHRSFLWRVWSLVTFMVTALWAALRAGRPDVVMSTTPPIFQPITGWLVSVLRWRPFLLEVRDLWPEFAIGMGVLRNPALIWFARRLENFLYARATHILVNSPAYRDYLIAKGVPAAKISLVANGVDVDLIRSDATGQKLRDELNLDGQFVVTYAGALGQANDLGTLLLAAQRLRNECDIRFLLIGDGKERANLQRQASEMQLPNVTFAAGRPKSEMSEVLAASDACVAILQDIPMFRTTYPNKVFDYMAAAKPVVLAIDGVIREVVDQAQCGVFVPPGNDAALADAILELRNQRQNLPAMGARGREFVAAHFNRTAQAEEFARVLSQLAGR